MMDGKNTYIAIDLKSFYASVECMERGLDPLMTNLVVADAGRTEKTICLAVSPSLKAYGIPGRARLFEVVQTVNRINALRRKNTPEGSFLAGSVDADVLQQHPDYELDYITAMPRMALYIDYSTRIYNIYLKYIAPEDIHVYSIDEVFIDITHYLNIYKLEPVELARKMINEIYEQTGITATAGIGTNLYLSKIAMDIVAKHMKPDKYGVRIAKLDEMSYRMLLWTHEPLSDFWRVGSGYVRKLHEQGLYTMGDIALCSMGSEDDYYNADLLYRMFGVNAELLIDHAWGYEPSTIQDIKAYKPEYNSVGSGQVLQEPYPFEKGMLIVREMADLLTLDLVEKGLVTNQMVLTIGYDVDNLTNPGTAGSYKGEITIDRYGRRVPKHAHGTVNLPEYTSSTSVITEAVLGLYQNIVNDKLLIRRVNITANRTVPRDEIPDKEQFVQLDLFTDYDMSGRIKKQQEQHLDKEQKMQEAMIAIKKKYGKNAILKGTNLSEGATALERNRQIGGHRA